MSKDIWHKADETPKPYEDIAFYVDGYLYFASYQPQYNQYGIFGADKVEKWCYVKDLSSYIPALETELKRTRKVLKIAVDALKVYSCKSGNWAYGYEFIDLDGNHTAGYKADTALEQITALEQKE